MADSVGRSFPTHGLHVGHIHLDLATGSLYRYLGGDPTDTTANWLLAGGELTSDPDTSSWGSAQRGALWFNTTDQSFRGWNGTQIVLVG